jgi:hypothetical protein
MTPVRLLKAIGWSLALAFGSLLLRAESASPAMVRVEIGPGSAAELVDATTAGDLLTVEDDFVRAMSPFDRSARLKIDRDVSPAEYLRFVARQTRPWSEADRARLVPILKSFRRRTADLKMRMPPIVRFVKTTGLEEGMAAYCRGPVVVLPENIVGGDLAKLPPVVFHELFHVFSTHNRDKRRALYAAVGFEACPEIPLPAELAARKVTNPDAPRIDAFCRVRVGQEDAAVAPVLLGKSELYDVKKGGEFFQQMDFRLMVLDETGGGLRPAIAGGAPRLLPLSSVPDYFERVGRNTEYVISPEEVLADNFVLLIDGKGKPVPSPGILEKLRAVLTSR